MTKSQVKDLLLEHNRRLRIERDNGNDSVTDEILKINRLLSELSKLDKNGVRLFVQDYGLDQ